jgi:cytochrome c553
MNSPSRWLTNCNMTAVVLLVLVTLPIDATDLSLGKQNDLGKIKAATVCAACHGANGVSVADHIPNLAGQKAGYLAAQLTALKNSYRKSDVMNVIAASLSEHDITYLATYFSEQPGAAASAKSSFLPNLSKARFSFPANYKTTFTRYHVNNVPDDLQVKHYYANNVALEAAKIGQPLPNGSFVIVEIFSAKLDNNKKPIAGEDGFFIPDQLRSYATMARDAGWGNDIPEVLRNEHWNYAVFSPDRTLSTRINQAECLACHVPASRSSYVFTLAQMASAK